MQTGLEWKNEDIAALISGRLGRRFDSSTLCKLLSTERALNGREAHVMEQLFGSFVPFPWSTSGVAIDDRYRTLREGDTVWSGEADLFDEPPFRWESGLYKIEVTDPTAAPRYRLGEIIWASTVRQAKPGDDVYVELIERKTHESISMIRECLAVAEHSYTFGLWRSGVEEKHDRRNLLAVRPIALVER